MTTATFAEPRWDPNTRTSLLPPDWPLVLICAGMPLAFIIGIHGFIWVLPVFVFGAQLLASRQPIVVPRSCIPLLMLVLWIPIPMLQLHRSAIGLASFRWLVFASPLLCFLWLMNQSESVVSTQRVVRLLATLWTILIAFGYLAILFPHFQATSPIQRLMPGSFISNSYIHDITELKFGDVQQLVSISVGRPSAPMAYSNGWGSTLGLLTPFFVLHYFVLGNARRRRIGFVIAVAAILPIVQSLNRGLWLSIAVAFGYVAIRRAVQGNLRVGIAVIVAVLAVFGTLAVTTLGNTVQQRFEISSESNNARSELYQVAIDVTAKHPLVGYGAPVNAGLWRDVGTHGLIWFVMVAYGYPGLVFLVAWMLATLFATARAPNPTALWAHVAILVFIVQSPIYGLLPQLAIAGIAAAVALRAQVQEPVPKVERRPLRAPSLVTP